MFDCILPIGQSCNITFLLQNANLKKQTTLFEWFVSPTLQGITDCLIQIYTNTDEDIVSANEYNQVFIGKNIYSSHYKYGAFLDIYERRKERFIHTLCSSTRILFCRFEETIGIFEKTEIDSFIHAIQLFNPSLEVVLLLISPETDIEHPSLHKIVYTKDIADPCCKSQEINTLFSDALHKLGYNSSDTTDVHHTDISDMFNVV